MKKLILLLSFMVIGITFNSCVATFQTATAITPEWIEKQIHPSQLFINGNVSFSGKLSDGSTYSLLKDYTADLVDTGYYNFDVAEFGRDGSEWNDRIHNPKLGHLYINPNKLIAVYINPYGGSTKFKVNIVD